MLSMWVALACIPRTPSDCVPTYGDNCECQPMCVPKSVKRAIEQGPQCDIACEVYFDSGAAWTCGVEQNACVVVWNE